jgi:mRNA interferase MazF
MGGHSDLSARRAPFDRIQRGTIVIARAPEDNKAGRPVLIIRADALIMTPWFATLPFTTDLDLDMPHWVRVEPTPENGLERPSRVMVDWPQTVWRSRIDRVIGTLDKPTLAKVTAQFAAALGV